MLFTLGSLAAAGHGHSPSIPALTVGLVALVAAVALLPPSRSPALMRLAEFTPLLWDGNATDPGACAYQQAQIPGVVGALLESRDILTHGNRRIADELIIALLPRLQPADALRLTALQRRKLYESLALEDADRHERYLLTVLYAVEQIGDEEALRHVQRLVERGAVTAAQQRLCEVAAACGARIEAGLPDRRSHSQLLRMPASTADPSVLLRPQSGSTTKVEFHEKVE
jgi:hypothetical protein